MGRRYSFFLLFLLCTFLSSEVWAVAQRMVVASGRYSVAPRSARGVPAYCLDFTRSAPTAQTNLGHVLTSPESLVIRTPTGTLSGREAIRQGVIRIRGRDHPGIEFLSEVLSRFLDPNSRALLSPEDQAMWEEMSPSEKAQLVRVLSQRGDHASLEIENLKGYPIEIESRGAIIGERPESVPRLFDKLASQEDLAASPGDQLESQRNLWRSENLRRQEQLVLLGYETGPLDGEVGRRTLRALRNFQTDNSLKVAEEIDPQVGDILDKNSRLAIRRLQEELEELGFSTGSADGLIGPLTRTAIREFQSARNLPQTSLFDGATVRTLHTVSTNQRLGSANKRLQEVKILSIERRMEDEATFTLNTGDLEPAYSGGSILELTRTLDQYMREHAPKLMLVELVDFPKHKVAGLRSSLELAGMETERASRLRLLDMNFVDAKELAPLFLRPAELSEMTQVAGDLKRGFHQQILVRTVPADGDRSTRLNVWTRTERLLRTFMTQLKGAFSSRDPESTFIDLAMKAREGAKLDLNLTNEELDRQLRLELSRTQIVETVRRERLGR